MNECIERKRKGYGLVWGGAFFFSSSFVSDAVSLSYLLVLHGEVSLFFAPSALSSFRSSRSLLLLLLLFPPTHPPYLIAVPCTVFFSLASLSVGSAIPRRTS